MSESRLQFAAVALAGALVLGAIFVPAARPFAHQPWAPAIAVGISLGLLAAWSLLRKYLGVGLPVEHAGNILDKACAQRSERLVLAAPSHPRPAPFKLAVLNDIAANLPALEAVVADARAQGATAFAALGHTAVFGPQPLEALRWVRGNCEWCLPGYWEHKFKDLDLLRGESMFRKVESVEWSYRLLQSSAEGREMMAWLIGQPNLRREGRNVFAGSIPLRRGLSYSGRPRGRSAPGQTDPGLPNVSPEDMLFLGGWTWSALVEAGGKVTFECSLPPSLPWRGGQWLALGSVGLPGDDDPRASYLLLDEATFSLRRVPYDVPRFLEIGRSTTHPPQLLERRVDGAPR